MIDAGLTPRDPVRWWFAYAIEQADREDEQRRRPRGGDIQVLDPDESATL